MIGLDAVRRTPGVPVMQTLTRMLPDARDGEVFDSILARPGARIGRIVSHGQAAPADRPLVQPPDEWALLLAGAAAIRIADGPDRPLVPATICSCPPANHAG